jgi:hypothetical protein
LSAALLKNVVRQNTLRFIEHGVMADGESLQIWQVSAATQDPQHLKQKHIPGTKACHTPRPGMWDRSQMTDQIEIGWG